MKTVRLKDNIVVEIIPEYALPVEKWYGKAFAEHCMEAPDEVNQNWLYNPETGVFNEPVAETEPITPAQQREEAYNTQAVIEWGGDMLTVTQAAQLWQYYAAEGDFEKTDELTGQIAAAKQMIREQYPDAE